MRTTDDWKRWVRRVSRQTPTRYVEWLCPDCGYAWPHRYSPDGHDCCPECGGTLIEDPS